MLTVMNVDSARDQLLDAVHAEAEMAAMQAADAAYQETFEQEMEAAKIVAHRAARDAAAAAHRSTYDTVFTATLEG